MSDTQNIPLEAARKLVMAGRVRMNDQPADKCGQLVPIDSRIQIVGTFRPYVSRGGEKLAGVLAPFGVDPRGKIVLDAGISTGGFTDCLLQSGAAAVVGIDVSYGLTDVRIRDDKRVFLLERTNVRKLSPADFTAKLSKLRAPFSADQIELVVMDVSFISIQKVIPAVRALVHPDAVFVVLIKPQFEAPKELVQAGGIVPEDVAKDTVLPMVERFLDQMGVTWQRLQPSPIKGTKGNQEYFVAFQFHTQE